MLHLYRYDSTSLTKSSKLTKRRLKHLISTKDLDEIIHTIVTGRQLCNELHNSFLKNPRRMKRKDLIGYGDEYLTEDEFYSTQLYLKDIF